jgi:hypothetical protein
MKRRIKRFAKEQIRKTEWSSVQEPVLLLTVIVSALVSLVRSP